MAKDSPQDLKNREYFSNNLNKLMKEKGVRQIDLHNALDIPKSTITGYIKGRSMPTFGNIQKIADFLNVKKSELDPRFKADSSISSPSPKILSLDRNLKDPQHSQWIAYGEELLAKQTAELGQNVVEEKIVSLDDYRKRVDKSAPGKVSAGTGFWQEDDYDTMVSFYEDEIPDDDDYDTIAIVVGHSMEPKIKNGDFLFIKLTNSIDVNKIGVFQVNGENYVKKLKQGYLESLNKEYDNIELSEHDDIRTIGEVVSVYREN